MTTNKSASLRELALWTTFLCVMNARVWMGLDPSSLFLFPNLAASEPWRWLTHPFVHVSRYHFLLDTSVLITLLAALPGSPTKRFIAFSVCAFGSTLGALLGPHDLNLLGFGGLSGAAHGLTFLVATQLALDPSSRENRLVRTLAGSVAIMVLFKALFEVLSGGVVLASWHTGSIGTPIVACHLGGAISGALLAWKHLKPLIHFIPRKAVARLG